MCIKCVYVYTKQVPTWVCFTVCACQCSGSEEQPREEHECSWLKKKQNSRLFQLFGWMVILSFLARSCSFCLLNWDIGTLTDLLSREQGKHWNEYLLCPGSTFRWTELENQQLIDYSATNRFSNYSTTILIIDELLRTDMRNFNIGGPWFFSSANASGAKRDCKFPKLMYDKNCILSKNYFLVFLVFFT